MGTGLSEGPSEPGAPGLGMPPQDGGGYASNGSLYSGGGDQRGGSYWSSTVTGGMVGVPSLFHTSPSGGALGSVPGTMGTPMGRGGMIWLGSPGRGRW